jgi:hypothetical protein
MQNENCVWGLTLLIGYVGVWLEFKYYVHGVRLLYCSTHSKWEIRTYIGSCIWYEVIRAVEHFKVVK